MSVSVIASFSVCMHIYELMNSSLLECVQMLNVYESTFPQLCGDFLMGDCINTASL